MGDPRSASGPAVDRGAGDAGATAVGSAEPAPHRRWFVAGMGTVLQLCLGTVYAWSYFQKPLTTHYGWSNSQAAWAFSLAIGWLGLAAAWGGVNLPRFGPRRLAMIGGLLYALGYLLGSLALARQSLVLFYLGFGVVGGIGLGLGYVTPVATAAKWFPDRKGMVTGMVVMGFGLGALLMSKVIAPLLMARTGGDLVQVFLYTGLVMLVLTLPAGFALCNPPAGFVPPGYTPPAAAGGGAQPGQVPVTARACVLSAKFARLWLVFFLNITAGIMFIGFQSPMLQELLKSADPARSTAELAAAGATLIGVSSLFNGVGRFLWGAVSDRIGRVQTFRLILGSQAAVFVGLLVVRNPWVFGILVCYVLLCYGGGFGSMPSYVLDVFGPARMAVVYGTILTAWSAAGVVGPQLAAVIRDRLGADAGVYTFGSGAVLLAVGLGIAFSLDNRRFEEHA